MMKKLLMIVVAVMIAVMIGGTAHAELIVAYGFNGSLADISGNGYDGIGDGVIAYAADVPEALSGQSLVLDGDSTVEAPISEVNPFDGSGDFSIAVWFKTEQAGLIISSARDSTNDNHSLAVFVRDNGTIAADNFYVAAANSSDGFNDGQWHHLVVLYTSAEEVYDLVIDGEFNGSNGFNPDIPNIVEDTVLIGNSLNTTFPVGDESETFVGNLKDLAIFNHVLSEEEIADLMANGLSPLSASEPDPSNGETVKAANPLTLSWTNLEPTDPGDLVYVDVLWGTEPNALHPAYDMAVPIITAESIDSTDVDSLALDTYYWRVDSYLNGADDINEPNRVEGQLWSYTTVADMWPTVEIVTPDQMTWLGEGVPLDTTVTDDGESALTYLWTADPPHGVAFDSDSIANPIVTFTNRILIREIQDAWDDGEEFINSEASGASVAQGTMTMGSNDLELGADNNAGLNWQVIAVQYADLGIPQGSTITSAKITFQINGDPVEGESNDLSILAEAADDAAIFDDEVLYNISDRDRTTASVPWAPDPSPAVGDKVDTPDISTLIQEVVDRPGWSANNRLMLMIYPDVYLASPTGGTTTVQEMELEADPGSDSATLSVTYEPPAGSPPLSVASTFTVTVAVSDEANPTPDTASIEIDVYDDACQMARFGQGRSAITDFNVDCITGLEELVVMVEAWLDDYSSTGPVDRP